MKLNLNNYLISSKQYMEYLSYKLDTDSYEFFSNTCSAEKILHPYLYTIHEMPTKAVEGFYIFLRNYLDKCEIAYEWTDDISLMISDDTTLKIAFILAAQYYFL